MSFSKLKKNRAAAIDKLVSAAETASGPKGSMQDERKWKPTVDKAGNGYAVIRFLPAPEGEDLPWVRYWDHAFKGPTGQWFIEKSLTTLEQPDPVSELNSELWNSDPGDESHKKVVRLQKRRLHYVANIMVMSDPSAPENEGKVFLYVFGKKIFDKLMDVMQPQFPDDVPLNPFDFWDGADFKLKIRQVDGYRNYDKSEFSAVSQLMHGEGEDKLEGVYNSLYKLQDIIDPKEFKSYAQLESHLNKVLGKTAAAGPSSSARDPDKTSEAKSAPSAPVMDNDDQDADEGDTMSYFEKLAQED